MNKPRRAKSKRLLPLPLDENETKCGICLDDVVKRGKIGPCSHLFCFSCLLEWSKVNNTCPQCKLIFRCISRIDFATHSFEEKVFIKDKTLRTGHVSSEEEDYTVHSSEIEDSDPDFIDQTEHVPNALSEEEDEEEAQFTQQPCRKEKRTKRKSPVASRGRKNTRVWSDSSEEEGENDVNYLNILNRCRNGVLSSPNSSKKVNVKSPPSPDILSAKNASAEEQSPVVFEESPKPTTSSSKKRKKLTSPNLRDGPRPRFSSNSPKQKPSVKSIYFGYPKPNKDTRWASLNQKVRNTKKKRTLKNTGKSTRGSITISTLSNGSHNNTSTWLTTRHSKYSVTSSEINTPFKVPFKKTPTTETEELFEDPEEYFASIING